MRFSLALALSCAATAARAQSPADALSTLSPAAGIAITHHAITLHGRVLHYTARAGLIPIRDNETGTIHGRLFFIAYTLDGAPKSPRRPITFAWNGGPGSSSSLVHLIGFGPKRLFPDGSWRANDGTWLEATDLVFVDPIGTGYSRPATAAFGAEFYSDAGDAASVAEFIRVYLTRAEAWDAPLFLAGESFGVRRAARVANVLQQHGTAVRGVILLGLALPLDTLSTPMRAALAVPTFTAAAYYHKRLPPDLQQLPDARLAMTQAWSWAQTRYAPALARRDSLTPAQRDTIRAELARWAGIAAAKIDPKTLALPLEQFSQQLLRDRALVVGRYDTRLTGPLDTTETEFDPTKDPSLVNIIDDHAVSRYLRSELRYESDLRYQGPFGGGYPPATSFRGDWMSVKWNWNPPIDSTQPPPDPMRPLERALRTNPALRVLAVCGDFDLMCDWAANAEVRKGLEPALGARVEAREFAGGHAVYTDAEARVRLMRDVTRFIADVPPP